MRVPGNIPGGYLAPPRRGMVSTVAATRRRSPYLAGAVDRPRERGEPGLREVQHGGRLVAHTYLGSRFPRATVGRNQDGSAQHCTASVALWRVHCEVGIGVMDDPDS